MSMIFGCWTMRVRKWLSPRIREIFRCVEGWVHLATQHLLDLRQNFEEMTVAQALGDDHDVDVARRRIRALGHGTIDEGATNKVGNSDKAARKTSASPKVLRTIPRSSVKIGEFRLA